MMMASESYSSIMMLRGTPYDGWTTDYSRREILF